LNVGPCVVDFSAAIGVGGMKGRRSANASARATMSLSVVGSARSSWEEEVAAEQLAGGLLVDQAGVPVVRHVRRTKAASAQPQRSAPQPNPSWLLLPQPSPTPLIVAVRQLDRMNGSFFRANKHHAEVDEHGIDK
jgi:hypothetical protein